MQGDLLMGGHQNIRSLLHGGWGPARTRAGRVCLAQNSTMVGRRGCVPAPRGSRLPLCWALGTCWAWAACPPTHPGTIIFSSCGERLHPSLVSAPAPPLLHRSGEGLEEGWRCTQGAVGTEEGYSRKQDRSSPPELLFPHRFPAEGRAP